MTLTITARLGEPNTVEGDRRELDRLPEMARARRRIRDHLVPFALIDELTHPRYIGHVCLPPTRRHPSPTRYLAVLDYRLLQHTQPQPLRRNLGRRSARG